MERIKRLASAAWGKYKNSWFRQKVVRNTKVSLGVDLVFLAFSTAAIVLGWWSLWWIFLPAFFALFAWGDICNLFPQNNILKKVNAVIGGIVSVGVFLALLFGLFAAIAAIFMLVWNAFPAVVITAILPIGFWQACLGVLALWILIALIVACKSATAGIFDAVTTMLAMREMKKMAKQVEQEQSALMNIFRHLGEQDGKTQEG